MGERAGAARSSPRRPIVAGIFEDEVRAEQAVRALEVWRRANRRSGVRPIAVVARRVSGAVTWRARGVTRPGRGALTGLVVGLLLFALPAMGAAGLAAWVVGNIVFGLVRLVGLLSTDQAAGLVVAVMLVSVSLTGLLVGLVGAVLGGLVGLLVGFIDRRVRGLRRSEVSLTASALGPGAWAAVARVEPMTEPLVRDELIRLGAVPAVLHQRPPDRGAPVAAPPAPPAA